MYKTKRYRTKKYKTKKYKTKKYKTKKYNKAKGLDCVNNVIYTNCLYKKICIMDLEKINEDFNRLKENLINHYPGIKTRFVNTTLKHLLSQLKRDFETKDCTKHIEKCLPYLKSPKHSTRSVRIFTEFTDDARKDAELARILADKILNDELQ